MEMLSGGDILRRLINRVIKNHIPSELDISHLFKGVVLALQSIHEKAYLHRDLKYNNIILVSDRDDSSVKIIDFGSMMKLPEGDGFCVREELVGTPGFYAPESISRSEYSFKTDIWQLGCILYWSVFPSHSIKPSATNLCIVFFVDISRFPISPIDKTKLSLGNFVILRNGIHFPILPKISSRQSSKLIRFNVSLSKRFSSIHGFFVRRDPSHQSQ